MHQGSIAKGLDVKKSTKFPYKYPFQDQNPGKVFSVPVKYINEKGKTKLEENEKDNED